jgi:hypothetical protein
VNLGRLLIAIALLIGAGAARAEVPSMDIGNALLAAVARSPTGLPRLHTGRLGIRRNLNAPMTTK